MNSYDPSPKPQEATFFNVFDWLDFRKIKDPTFLDKVQRLVNRWLVRFGDEHLVFTNGMWPQDLKPRIEYENILRWQNWHPRYVDLWRDIAQYVHSTLTPQWLGQRISSSAREYWASQVYFFTWSEVSEEVRNQWLWVNTSSLQTLMAANNKLLVIELWEAGDIINLDVNDEERAIYFFNKFGRDVFIKKPLDGWSNGVVRITSENQLTKTINARKSDKNLGTMVIMQKTIDDGEHDFADTCNVYLHLWEGGVIEEIYPGPLMQEKNKIEHVGNKTYGISRDDADNLMRLWKNLAEKLFEKTGYTWPAWFNFVKSREWRVFMEVNARVNGSSMLTDPMHEFGIIDTHQWLSRPFSVKDNSYASVVSRLRKEGILFNGQVGAYPLYPQGEKFTFSVYGKTEQEVIDFSTRIVKCLN